MGYSIFRSGSDTQKIKIEFGFFRIFSVHLQLQKNAVHTAANPLIASGMPVFFISKKSLC
jgi:hypothetical protein